MKEAGRHAPQQRAHARLRPHADGLAHAVHEGVLLRQLALCVVRGRWRSVHMESGALLAVIGPRGRVRQQLNTAHVAERQL